MFMHYSSNIVVFQQTKQHFKKICVDDALWYSSAWCTLRKAWWKFQNLKLKYPITTLSIVCHMWTYRFRGRPMHSLTEQVKFLSLNRIMDLFASCISCFSCWLVHRCSPSHHLSPSSILSQWSMNPWSLWPTVGITFPPGTAQFFWLHSWWLLSRQPIHPGIVFSFP